MTYPVVLWIVTGFVVTFTWIPYWLRKAAPGESLLMSAMGSILGPLAFGFYLWGKLFVSAEDKAREKQWNAEARAGRKSK